MYLFWCLHPSLKQNPKNLFKRKIFVSTVFSSPWYRANKTKNSLYTKEKKGKKRKAGLYLYFNFLKTFQNLIAEKRQKLPTQSFFKKNKYFKGNTLALLSHIKLTG